VRAAPSSCLSLRSCGQSVCYSAVPCAHAVSSARSSLRSAPRSGVSGAVGSEAGAAHGGYSGVSTGRARDSSDGGGGGRVSCCSVCLCARSLVRGRCGGERTALQPVRRPICLPLVHTRALRRLWFVSAECDSLINHESQRPLPHCACGRWI